MPDDTRWMDEALAEARLGLGRTAPNPAVGCVLVKGKRLVGRGHHRKAGGPHGEVAALRAASVAGNSVRGSTAYVTLEPCVHTGRTGPCTEALIEAGVARVVYGCTDPNPLVAGRGVRRLRRAGIEVRGGVRGAACRRVIRGFAHRQATGRPFVRLKLAATLDGRIAARNGVSQWISCADSRRMVQTLRGESDAVMVGAGTAVADDPRLNCRIPGASQPLRVLLDGSLRTPADARLVRGKGRSLIFTRPQASRSAEAALVAAGAEVVRLDLRGPSGVCRVLEELGRRGVGDVLLEGGGVLAASALRGGMVNEALIFYSPGFLGGDGLPMVGALGLDHPRGAISMTTRSVVRVGDDILWTGVPK